MKTSNVLRFSSMVLLLCAFSDSASADPEPELRALALQESRAHGKAGEPSGEQQPTARARLEPAQKTEKNEGARSDEQRQKRQAAARDVTLMMLGITRSSARGR